MSGHLYGQSPSLLWNPSSRELRVGFACGYGARWLLLQCHLPLWLQGFCLWYAHPGVPTGLRFFSDQFFSPSGEWVDTSTYRLEPLHRLPPRLGSLLPPGVQ